MLLAFAIPFRERSECLFYISTQDPDAMTLDQWRCSTAAGPCFPVEMSNLIHFLTMTQKEIVLQASLNQINLIKIWKAFEWELIKFRN